MKDQYEKNLIEVTQTKNNDGLSGIDKMAMSLDKYDEGIVVLVDLNVETTIQRIREMVDVPITDDEIDYYMKHLTLSEMQTEYVYAFYANYFGTFRDLHLLTRRQYITLLLIMKKILLIDLGYDPETKDVKQAALPYILSGNLEDRIVNRMVRNARFLEKLESSPKYQKLVNDEYSMLLQINGKEDFIKSRLSTLINTRFTYVTYEEPELTGQVIEYDEEEIADELLDFFQYYIR